jgi:hypothetical protein
MTSTESSPTTQGAEAKPRGAEAKPRGAAELHERLAGVAGMGPGQRRLVVLLPQLGDFDSMGYT